MLFPKKVKHRKWQIARKSEAKRNAVESRGITVAFGAYGLKAETPARVKSNQIEAARRVISRTLGKAGKVWIRIFPDQPVTKKPAEVGMGKGKGDPEHFIFEVRPGRVIFEIDGVSEAIAREAFRKATAKLPLKAKVVTRADTMV
jgi:large subunit ribosomal protein L16